MAKSIPNIVTKQDYDEVAKSIISSDGFVLPVAFAIGYATLSDTGEVLCVNFPHVNLREKPNVAAILSEVCGRSGAFLDKTKVNLLLNKAFFPFVGDGERYENIEALELASKYEHCLFVSIDDLRAPAKSVADAYLRMYLISLRRVRPDEINMDGICDMLINVVWTDLGPWKADTYERHVAVYLNGGAMLRPKVFSVGKLPWMTDFVLPSGVTILDASYVTLGTYIEPGAVIASRKDPFTYVGQNDHLD